MEATAGGKCPGGRDSDRSPAGQHGFGVTPATAWDVGSISGAGVGDLPAGPAVCCCR